MLQALLLTVVNKYPHKTAIVHKERRLSYAELYNQVSGFSQNLSSLGIGQTDCVALLLPNCPEFVTSFYAAIKLNAIILPLNHLFKEEEISYYLKDSNAKVLITDAYRFDLCQQVISSIDRDIQLIVIDSINPHTIDFQHRICSEPRVADEIVSADVSSEALTSRGSADAIYQYSSGSTGRPKRVHRTQYNLYREITNFTETVKITTADNILGIVPLYHAHGLGNCLLAALSNGASLILLEQPTDKAGIPIEVPFIFRCPRVLELLETERITILPGVPYIFQALAETPITSSVDVSALKLCFSAGNFLPKAVFDKFMQRFKIPVRQLYGCTEAGSVAINLNGSPENTWNAVGYPVKTVEIKIVDEHGIDLPHNEIGEIVIKSQSLTLGYHAMPRLNQQAFRNGAFFTGDLGKVDDQGQLYITGRKKILIDTGGRKVDPIEIEDLLITHPAVKEAVVVGIKDANAGEVVKAVIVLHSADTAIQSQEQAISTYCKSRIAAFKVPKVIEFRHEIPKSPLGKILRKELV